jgi:tetratricopeptide (TPR) repeat protein
MRGLAMGRRGAAAMMLVLAVGAAGCASEPPPPVVDPRPWQAARVTLDAALIDASRGGPRALAPHAEALERALADAQRALALTRGGKGGVVLADGPAETAAALAEAGGTVTALDNPYPPLSLALGSHYVAAGRPADALRVLDAGLALPPPVAGLPPGPHAAPLLGERAAALGLLARWPESLAVCDRGLRLPGLADKDRARFLRGRGVALMALKRPNEAEVALRSALALDPDDSRIRDDLAAVAGLRRGRPLSPAQMGAGNR